MSHIVDTKSGHSKSLRGYIRTITFSIVQSGIICCSTRRRNSLGKNCSASKSCSANSCVCWLKEDPFRECEFELNPCFDHFAQELFQSRLVAAFSESDLVPIQRFRLNFAASRDSINMPSVYDCPVCFCEYAMDANHNQTPYVLPCGHSVCYLCSFKLSQACKEAKCPFCRRPLPIQNSNFSVNYALLAVLDQKRGEQKPVRPTVNLEARGRNIPLGVLSKTNSSLYLCAAKSKLSRANSFPAILGDVPQFSNASHQLSDCSTQILAGDSSTALKSVVSLKAAEPHKPRSNSCIHMEPFRPRLDTPISNKGSMMAFNRSLNPCDNSGFKVEQPELESRMGKTPPPAIPPHIPLHYNFIQAGEVIPKSRLPSPQLASTSSAGSKLEKEKEAHTRNVVR